MRLILYIIIFCPVFLFAQSWEVQEFIGGQENESLDVAGILSDGQLVVAGNYKTGLTIQGETLFAEGEEDIYCGIYSQEGTLNNLFSLGGENNESLTGMVIDNNDDITFYGAYFSHSIFDTLEVSPSLSNQGLFLVQYDKGGNIKWGKSIDGRLLNVSGNVSHDSEDNIIVTGYFLDSLKIGETILEAESNEGDLFVAKFDTNGNLLWAKRAGTSGIIRSTAVQTDSDNNIIIGGIFKGSVNFNNDFLETNTATHDVFVAKLNAEGVFIWGKKLGGVLEKELGNLVVDENDEIFLTGSFVGVLADGNGWEIQSEGFDQNAYLIRLDTDGNLVFGLSYGGEGDDFPIDISLQGDKIGITGYFSQSTQWDTYPLNSLGSFDAFVAVLDKEGAVLNLVSIGGEDFVLGSRVLFDELGEVIICGDFSSAMDIDGVEYPNQGNYDAFWLKSNATVKTEEVTQAPFYFYPNPVKDKIYFYSGQNIKIVNIKGEKIMDSRVGENDISHLLPGIYFISIEGMETAWKFIKK